MTVERDLGAADEIRVLSVGVDIGSSTSHLVFSRIVLEPRDSRYVVASREAFYESAIFLTPYAADEVIDAPALGAFIEGEYRSAGIDPNDIDTGALILTGLAVRRSNARAIGELFARQAGKLVAVSAGDGLETTMAAHGSGAVARSIRERSVVMNVDIGGGTSKIAIAVDGKIADLTAIDVGARLIRLDADGRILRVEEAARHLFAELGLALEPGMTLGMEDARALVSAMADRLFAAMRGATPSADGWGLLRLEPLTYRGTIEVLSFSGGVSEYIYGRETGEFGDLGQLFAAEVIARARTWGPRLESPMQGIRATVIGASQYTIQVSGSTIFVRPSDVLPLRDVPVAAPEFCIDGETIDAAAVAIAVKTALKRLDLLAGERPVAIFAPWLGSATFQRLDAFCRGLIEGLSTVLAAGHPLIVAGDGDLGGLIGMHCSEELHLATPIISIDGLELKDFDYIDIGRSLEATEAVPVVIKSLVFPAASPAS